MMSQNHCMTCNTGVGDQIGICRQASEGKGHGSSSGRLSWYFAEPPITGLPAVRKYRTSGGVKRMLEEHEQALATQTKGKMRAPGQADEGNEHRYSPRLCAGCIAQAAVPS
jgi:hypothetical protein